MFGGVRASRGRKFFLTGVVCQHCNNNLPCWPPCANTATTTCVVGRQPASKKTCTSVTRWMFLSLFAHVPFDLHLQCWAARHGDFFFLVQTQEDNLPGVHGRQSLRQRCRGTVGVRKSKSEKPPREVRRQCEATVREGLDAVFKPLAMT